MGDILIRAGLVTEEQVATAIDRQIQDGGRLGDHLAAMGAISPEILEGFLHRTPSEPSSLADTGIEPLELLDQLLKLIYVERMHSISQFSNGIKLPPHLVMDLVRMAVERQFLQATSAGDAGFGNLHYSITEQGKRWAVDALQQCRYTGPAPVTLHDFTQQVSLQKPTNETISPDRLRKALGDLVVDDDIIEQSGPAMTTGRAMLFYGPPGNGKTSVAMRLATVYKDIVYIPYAVSVDGQIIRVFDSSLHEPVDSGDSPDDELDSSFVRRDKYDTRWIPCRRPFVVIGGELTLEMLELRYDSTFNYYEAPLHVKALSGCLLIDDFGRQLLSPTHLLNRWIVPLESHVDFLRLQSGKTFQVPFEEVLIFSTNLEPEDLMDPAFLRRLPFKIEVRGPSLEQFRRILALEADRFRLELTEDTIEQIIFKITIEKQLELAAFHPRFIVDQVVATCRFLGEPPHFHPRFIDYAVNNLRVHRQTSDREEVHAHF